MQTQLNIRDTSSPRINANLVVTEDIDLSLQLDYAFANGVERVCIFLEATAGTIPRNKPKQLRDEIVRVVQHHTHITDLKFTRQHKLLVETNNVDCAKGLANLTVVLGIPVKTYVQNDNITTRFALHNIDPKISLSELGTELQASNHFKIKELRRFTTRQGGTLRPSETVLVTVFGTCLPNSVKFFYMTEKIRPFYDRPRQCSKCWHFDHVIAKCTYEVVCRKCSGNHLHADCSSSVLSCGNCKGPHEATDARCPVRLQEMQLLKFKSDQHIPLTEARRRFRQLETKSYASAVKTSDVFPPAASAPIPPTSALDSILSDFLVKAQEALQNLLQQQLIIFQNHLSSLLQQQLETVMKVSSTGFIAATRESHSSQSSQDSSSINPDELRSLHKRLRLNPSDLLPSTMSAKIIATQGASADMSVDKG